MYQKVSSEQKWRSMQTSPFRWAFFPPYEKLFYTKTKLLLRVHRHLSVHPNYVLVRMIAGADCPILFLTDRLAGRGLTPHPADRR
jgi:hypothetical protein